MIIVRTPFRLSFFGGGTDYPDWYRKHGGAVLSTTIDKYCWLTIRYLPPFHEHRFRIVYRKIEMCQQVEEIEHPAVRAVLQHLNKRRGLEIHHDGDLPARSGMGSSSAFTVGLLHAIHALCGRLVSKDQLAREAIHVEQEILQETVGSQDQTAVAYGGLNLIKFNTDGSICVEPITLRLSRLHELESHLMLFFSSVSRSAEKIAKSYVNNLDDQADTMRRIHNYVYEAVECLQGSDSLQAFGALLDQAWQHKRQLSSQIANQDIRDIYSKAMNAGAWGGKLTGAGGGGFMLFVVPPEKRISVREALHDLVHVPFHFDREGSKIIHYTPAEDFAEIDMDRSSRKLREFTTNEHSGGEKANA